MSGVRMLYVQKIDENSLNPPILYYGFDVINIIIIIYIILIIIIIVLTACH